MRIHYHMVINVTQRLCDVAFSMFALTWVYTRLAIYPTYLIYSTRYGIFWMPPGESSHPGGSEYVWQRGVEGVLGWVTGGRSWPYFPKKNKLKWAVTKKSHSHNFRIWASKRKSLVAIVYGKKWFKFGSSNPKILGDTFFLNTTN